MLEAQFGLRALLVTEDSEEQARKDAAAIAHDNRYDAVVSVAMLREGWDVPEVGVVLPLRKMGSKVYAPQIIGRGLRRVRRPDIPADEPQICAVVDHPKLEHGWLWDLLRARVRENVGVDELFDEQGELPEPPPRQEIVEPELLITVPEPHDADDEFEPVDVAADDEPSRAWRELLDELEYPRELVEITDQQIAEVTAQELKPRGWTKHVGAPASGAAAALPELSDAELVESVRERVRDLAARATEQHGYAAIEQHYVYRAAPAARVGAVSGRRRCGFRRASGAVPRAGRAWAPRRDADAARRHRGRDDRVWRRLRREISRGRRRARGISRSTTAAWS